MMTRNICSESILFFPMEELGEDGEMGPSTQEPQLFDFHHPVLAGFNAARDDSETHNTTPGAVIRSGSVSSWSQEMNQPGFPANNQEIELLLADSLYQHPAKRQSPGLSHKKTFDLYSVGCVLLELGLWSTLEEILPADHQGDAQATMQILLEQSGNSLSG